MVLFTEVKANAKATLAFCGIKFTFLQNYNIRQRFAIGHDYPVPVDKYGCD